jgi:GDP-L-fucose synthase
MTEFFAARRFLVTGGAGFLGSEVVRALHARGAAHVGVTRSREHDLRTRAGCEGALAAHRPDVVIHLAATVGGIGANAARPGTFFRDNMLMGTQVVDACRDRGVEKIVVAGTVCAYPKHCPVPFREDTLWDGYPEETNAPYGVAKRALLVMLDAYRREFGLRSAFLLPANLYGAADNFDLESSHVIPALVRRMLEAKAAGTSDVTLWGDGTPTREFLHVRDAAEAFCLGAEHLDEPVPVNVGNAREVSIAALAELVRAAVGYEGSIRWDASRPNGQPRRSLDVSRARELLGFEAKVPLEEGLAELVAWCRERAAWR